MTKTVINRIENIVGKGENVDYQHFFPFPRMFPKDSFGSLTHSHTMTPFDAL